MTENENLIESEIKKKQEKKRKEKISKNENRKK